MQSIEVMEGLLKKQHEEKILLNQRYARLIVNYQERGWPIEKILVEFGPELDSLERKGRNISKVERLLNYYEGNLK